MPARDLSRLTFFGRVLAEAAHTRLPLAQRLRFLTIAASAIDEFDLVRRAVLYGADPCNTLPQNVPAHCHRPLRQRYAANVVWLQRLTRQLLHSAQSANVLHLHTTDADPVPYSVIALHAMASVQAGVLLNAQQVAVLPDNTPRWHKINATHAVDRLKVLQQQLHGKALVYAMRNAEITVNITGTGDEAACQHMLTRRQQTRLMRLDTDNAAAVPLLRDQAALVQYTPFVGVAQLAPLWSGLPAPALPSPAAKPLPNVWQSLQNNTDVLLHHPYAPFTAVENFLQQAARDPQVLALDHTLYRTCTPSSIIDALCEAAQKGKTVRVVIELRARFDEQANLHHASVLRAAGVQVLFGADGLKVHAKMTLAHTADFIYCHFGTGNYNPNTAKVYADISLFTRNQILAHDALALFNALPTGNIPQLQQLVAAPQQMKKFLLHNIAAQTQAITLKLNGLSDSDVANALQQAAQRGVQVRLSVRGMCVLKPQKNLHIRALIGQHLEHARIVVFGEGADARYFISSADHMSRNLDRRIETLVPVLQAHTQQKLLRILASDFADTMHSRAMNARKCYPRVGHWGRCNAYTQRYAN